MKASHIIPPVVAFIAAAAWNIAGWRSVSAVEEQVRALRTRIERAKTSPGEVAAAMGTPRPSKLKIPGGNEPLDWKNLSERMLEARAGGGAGDMRAMMDIESRIGRMSKEELSAALDEISSLGLDDEARNMLEEMLVDPLIEKDPQLALEKFARRAGDEEDGLSSQLSTALGAWAKKDAAAASAWLDRQIAAGVLDSKSLDGQSEARIEYEGALIGSLLATDAAAAEQRIAALPEDQRREALEQITFSELSPAGQKAYAGLVRGLVPEDERAGSFTHVISELIPEGGYTKVGAFLDDIQATPEERAVSAREAANSQLGEIANERPVTRQDVDAMRAWLDKQAPGTADRVTGEALADAAQEGGEFDFAEASRLALEYHKQSGNDDVLVAFLESFAAHSNLEKALSLANHISDPKRRQEILDRLQ